MDFKRLFRNTPAASKRRKKSPDAEDTAAPLTDVMRLQRLLGNQATTRIMRWEDPAMTSQIMGSLRLMEPSTLDAAPQEPHRPAYETMSFEHLLFYKDLALSKYDFAISKDSAEDAEKELALINAALEAKANAIFSGFNPAVTPMMEDVEILAAKAPAKPKQPSAQRMSFGLPPDAANRVKFINVMSLYVGGVEQLAAHYKNIRRANVPGIVFVHNSVADALEAVQNDIGKENMPTSGTALGVRNRFHERMSKSLMAHPLGYAIDYYPLDNSMVTDRRTLKLLSLVAGEPVNLQLENEKGGQIGRQQRRGMVTAMAEGKDKTDPALGAAVEHMMGQIDGEVMRVARASERFRKSLGTENTADLRKLRVEYLQLKAQQSRLTQMTSKDAVVKLLKRVLATHKGKLDPAAIKTMMKEAEAALEKADPKMESLLSPWTDMLQKRIEELKIMEYEIQQAIQKVEARLMEVNQDISTVEARKADIDKSVKSKEATPEEKKALAGERASLTKEGKSLAAEKASLTKEKTALEGKLKVPQAEQAALQQFTTQITDIEKNSEELAQTKAQMGKLTEKMQKNLAPWFGLIETDLKAQNDLLAPLETRLKALDERLQAITKRIEEIAARTKDITTALSAKGLTVETKAALVKEQGTLKKEREMLMAEKATLTAERAPLAKQAAAPSEERALLTSLQDALKDPDYILRGTTKEAYLDADTKDVAIMQLVHRGFFTIEGDEFDTEIQQHDGTMRENKKKNPEDTRKNFNATFMKAMMRHGFDLGIAWNTLDAMHFELVSAVESVKDEKETAEGFADVKDRYAERKPKVFKEPTPASGTP